jgi:hypothetical protein
MTVSMVVASIAGSIAMAASKRRIAVEDPEADEIHLVAAMEPIRFTARSTAFRGGSVEAWYGGGIVDLRRAILDPAGARLTFRTVFGGFEVAVPEAWHVVSSVKGIGGVGDNRRHVERPEDAPTLTVDGTAVFGGIGITSSLTEDEVRSIDEAIVRSARGRKRVAALVARARNQAETAFAEVEVTGTPEADSRTVSGPATPKTKASAPPAATQPAA